MRKPLPTCLIFCSLTALIITGCRSNKEAIERGIDESPTVQVIRGDARPGEYADRIAEKNREAREQEILEMNRDDSRVFNLATGRWMYLEGDVVGKYWNARNNRWEYLPPGEDPKEE